MVFYANHRLAAWQGGKRGTHRGDSFDQARMHTAVDDSVRLMMVRCDFKLRDHLIAAGMDEVNAHGLGPAADGSVERGSKVSVGRGSEVRVE